MTAQARSRPMCRLRTIGTATAAKPPKQSQGTKPRHRLLDVVNRNLEGWATVRCHLRLSSTFRFSILRPVLDLCQAWDARLASYRYQASNAASAATLIPMATSMVMAWSWKPSSHGNTINASPAIRLSHSSQTANAASAAIDSTAMMIPAIDAVCICAPLDRSNSQGEKNRTPLNSKLATSQSRTLDQSSMKSSQADMLSAYDCGLDRRLGRSADTSRRCVNRANFVLFHARTAWTA